MDSIQTEQDSEQGLRGLFRRGRRSDQPVEAPHVTTTSNADLSPTSTDQDVAEIDEIARRMTELSFPADVKAPEPSDPGTTATGDVRGALDLQRAAIARANRTASTGAGIAPPVQLPVAAEAPVPTPTPVATPAHTPTPAPVTPTTAATIPAPAQRIAPETRMNELDDLTPDTATRVEEDDIQARMDAVLAPTPTPAAQPTVTPTPAPAPAQVPVEAQLRQTAQAVQQAAPAPVQAPTPSPSQLGSGAPTATMLLGIDVDRMVNLLEDEARSAQQRIELEVRSAHTQAAEIVNRAEAEAERIREHGQAQARVLLGEVEEIISEAQATGEQILIRANEESSTLRGEATNVLHQAQAEARAIVETSRREGEQVLAEQRRLATVRAQEAMREQDRLKDQIRRLEERRRQVLESLEPLISQLTQMMPADIAAASAIQQQPGSGNVVQLDRTRGGNG